MFYRPGQSKPEESSSDSGESASGIDALRKFLSEKLKISDKDDEEKVKVLDDVSLDGIIDYFKKNNCKNIITMAGAGISTCKNKKITRIVGIQSRFQPQESQIFGLQVAASITICRNTTCPIHKPFSSLASSTRIPNHFLS